jgi:hypothetical protein
METVNAKNRKFIEAARRILSPANLHACFAAFVIILYQGAIDMPRIVHFEISADEPERAINFYKSIFGWDVQKWNGPEDYWLITTGPNDQPGINGGLFRRKGPVNYVNSIDVPSVDEYAEKILAHGGKVVAPKMTVPGVGYLVYVQDTEGNVFGLYQEDESVK